MTNPHFAWLPPEINSSLIFAGPGSGPLLAAASAWNGLAADLASSVASFGSVTEELTSGSWLGPSSVAMMAVATQYMGWLSAAAAQAEQAAAQAMATASAFEAALMATVQPAVVAANRGLMQVLVSTNWLGFNTPAIMDIEAAYEQMWALDVAAMAAYHVGASEAAAQLAPWQTVLHNLGIGVGNDGQISPGFGNAGLGNYGNGNLGNSNAGVGNSVLGNLGAVNSASSNLGLGNTGSNNFGGGNTGSGNIGFGNTGAGNLGFGLTGDHQVGFGGFNSASGNSGLFNSGTGNVGFFHSGSGSPGIGNSGSLNIGLGNPGTANMGFGNASGMNTGWWHSGMQHPAQAALVSTANYDTGGLSTATMSSGLLNSALMPTGDLNPGLACSGGAAPAAASLPVVAPPIGFDTGSPSASASGGSAANAGFRSPTGHTGFFDPNSSDSGLRNPPMQGSGTGSSAAPDSGATKPGFGAEDNRRAGDSVPHLRLLSPLD